MKTINSKRELRRGAALVTAIVFTAIFAILMAGIAVYAAGHYSLANRESDNAAAIQLADAAINYEVRYLSENQYSTGFTVHGTSNPDSGSISGVPGTFTVWVTTNSGGTWNNTDGNDMLLTATGTVNGITRKLQAEGFHGAGLFDNYAVFGTNSVTFNGSGSQVVGSIGTDGTVSSSSAGSGAVTGTISLDGSGATGVTGSNVVKNPDAINWPTVDQLVTSTYAGPPSGWSWITAHNNNGNARAFSGSGTSLVAGNVSPTKVSAISTSISLSKGTIILPPGDYYVTSVSLHGSGSIIVDNQGYSIDPTGKSAGLVRIWENGAGGDKLSNPIVYTATPADPSKFRWYDNSPGGFQIDGNTASGGAFYGVNAAGTGSFTITGGSYTYASVIANNVTISGNSSVEFPSGTIGSTTDTNWLWFGIQGGWKELPAGSGDAFSDGTSS